MRGSIISIISAGVCGLFTITIFSSISEGVAEGEQGPGVLQAAAAESCFEVGYRYVSFDASKGDALFNTDSPETCQLACKQHSKRGGECFFFTFEWKPSSSQKSNATKSSPPSGSCELKISSAGRIPVWENDRPSTVSSHSEVLSKMVVSGPRDCPNEESEVRTTPSERKFDQSDGVISLGSPTASGEIQLDGSARHSTVIATVEPVFTQVDQPAGAAKACDTATEGNICRLPRPASSDSPTESTYRFCVAGACEKVCFVSHDNYLGPVIGPPGWWLANQEWAHVNAFSCFEGCRLTVGCSSFIWSDARSGVCWIRMEKDYPPLKTHRVISGPVPCPPNQELKLFSEKAEMRTGGTASGDFLCPRTSGLAEPSGSGDTSPGVPVTDPSRSASGSIVSAEQSDPFGSDEALLIGICIALACLVLCCVPFCLMAVFGKRKREHRPFTDEEGAQTDTGESPVADKGEVSDYTKSAPHIPLSQRSNLGAIPEGREQQGFSAKQETGAQMHNASFGAQSSSFGPGRHLLRGGGGQGMSDASGDPPVLDTIDDTESFPSRITYSMVTRVGAELPETSSDTGAAVGSQDGEEAGVQGFASQHCCSPLRSRHRAKIPRRGKNAIALGVSRPVFPYKAEERNRWCGGMRREAKSCAAPLACSALPRDCCGETTEDPRGREKSEHEWRMSQVASTVVDVSSTTIAEHRRPPPSEQRDSRHPIIYTANQAMA